MKNDKFNSAHNRLLAKAAKKKLANSFKFGCKEISALGIAVMLNATALQASAESKRYPDFALGASFLYGPENKTYGIATEFSYNFWSKGPFHTTLTPYASYQWQNFPLETDSLKEGNFIVEKDIPYSVMRLGIQGGMGFDFEGIEINLGSGLAYERGFYDGQNFSSHDENGKEVNIEMPAYQLEALIATIRSALNIALDKERQFALQGTFNLNYLLKGRSSPDFNPYIESPKLDWNIAIGPLYRF